MPLAGSKKDMSAVLVCRGGAILRHKIMRSCREANGIFVLIMLISYLQIVQESTNSSYSGHLHIGSHIMYGAKLYNKITEIDTDSARKAFLHLLVAGVGSVSPLWITAIVFSLSNSKIYFVSFIEHGEAGICAVGVLLGASVLIARELGPPFKYRLVSFLLAGGLWTIAILIYACVQLNAAKNFGLNNTNLIIYSLLVWCLSLMLSSAVVFVDATREKLSNVEMVQRVRSQQFKDFQDEFEEAGDEI